MGDVVEYNVKLFFLVAFVKQVKLRLHKKMTEIYFENIEETGS